jgi:hypothetical protein
MAADVQNAVIGSLSDQAAASTAAVTEQAWVAAFSSIAQALADMPAATAALTSSASALAQAELPAGALYVTAEDAQEAVDAFAAQSSLTGILANGAAAFEELLSAVAQAWDVSQLTFASSGSTVQAKGGDLVLAAVGVESLSDGANATALCRLAWRCQPRMAGVRL